MAELDDAVARAREGDESAFAVLYRTLQPILLRYVRGVAPLISEDIASEVWLDVVRGLDTFSGGADGFRGWLLTIAHRRVVDARRHQAGRPETLVPQVPEAAVAPDAAEGAAERAGTDAAIELIGSLPPDQAEVVLLRVVAGLDVTAVAEIVGKRAGAVRVLSHRGLKRLAATLADRAEDDLDVRVIDETHRLPPSTNHGEV